jgi:short-subunit dehydrogenase
MNAMGTKYDCGELDHVTATTIIGFSSFVDRRGCQLDLPPRRHFEIPFEQLPPSGMDTRAKADHTTSDESRILVIAARQPCIANLRHIRKNAAPTRHSTACRQLHQICRATIGGLMPGWEPSCILITGASSGLGAGLARAYARPGRVLGLIARNAARLGAVADECRALGATVVEGVVDVTDSPGISAWLHALDTTLPIDLVIANAGVSAGTRPDGGPEGLDAARVMVLTNLLGVMQTIEPLLFSMRRRARGHIVVVSSVAAYRGLPDSPAYCATKAGVRIYGEALRAALRPYGVHVSVILPGFFDSPMSRRFRGPKPFLIPLDKAVARIQLGINRRERRVVFPSILGFLLRMSDLLPAPFGDQIIRLAPFSIVPEQ